MRITGIAIAVLGVVVAGFCALALGQELSPSDNDAAIRVERRASPDLRVPLAIAGGATLAGVLMAMYGGRGYRQEGPLPPPAAG